MNILLVNDVHYGSTGKIVRGIAETAKANGHSVFVAYSWTKKYRRETEKYEFVGSFLGKLIHMLAVRTIGYNGWLSRIDTWMLIRKLKRLKFSPDIVHLHMLHAQGFCLPLLFKYINKYNIPVIWTMHDMWAATGECCLVDGICDKWKIGCQGKCIQQRAFFNNQSSMWRMKKKLFLTPEKLIVVTPSKWMAKMMSESFFSNSKIEVVNNGIDLSVFKPRESQFRNKYNLNKKFVVLSVAMGWCYRKGLDVMIELSRTLPDKYTVVMVGTTSEVDKYLPDNIISIHRTANQIELAEIYSSADVFVIPTRQDNYPTVNMEALACGTPVITFNTGGSPEIISESCGITCYNNAQSMLKSVIQVCENNLFKREDCVKHASKFDGNTKYLQYISLYKNLLK